MSLEIYKKIEVENEIKKLIDEGKTRKEIAFILMDEDSLIDANYIIEACLMPIEEITKEIEKYDCGYPKLDESAFINELCIRYNVDRKAIIERIQNVRNINSQNSFDTKERLEKLKRKRDLLEREKEKLRNKSMDTEEKSMYYFGLGVVIVVGGLLFYPASPVLVGVIPVLYAVGLPTVRMSLLMKKECGIVSELVDLDKEIECVGNNLNSKNKLIFQVQCNIQDEIFIKENNKEYDCFVIDDMLIQDASCESIDGPTLIKRKK